MQTVLFFLFFLSGFCGLLYQIVWLRLAFSAFGIITPVLSFVLSIFMLGLALGTWLGGRVIVPLTRRTGKSAIYFYAGAELLVGLGAFAVPLCFRLGESLLLNFGGMDSTRYLNLSAFTILLSILPWCICMGATFPLMMAFTKELKNSENTSFSFLYLANVIGAMCGTLLTALFFIEFFGFRNTLLLAALANVLIAAVAVSLGKRTKAVPAPAIDAAPLATSTLSWEKSVSICLILFTTGFTSMAMEVVWTRAFTPYLKTTIYAFSGLLAVYLLATWLGSFLYRKHLRIGSVTATSTLVLRTAATAFIPVIVNDPRLHLGSEGALLSIFPFCFILGYLTPKLIDEYSSGHAKAAGIAYGLNILGGILGPLVAGYYLLPALGVRVSLIILALPFLFLVGRGIKNFKWVAATAVLLLIAVRFSISYEDAGQQNGGVLKRDYTATIIAAGEGLGKQLYVNGVSITQMSPITKIMAHMPLIAVNHRPQSGLAICFGMGTTFRSMMSWNMHSTAVELVPSVKDVFGYFFSDAEALLSDSRGKVVIDDGRRFLKRTNELFDVITIDPPPPFVAAGSSLLYSKEFYDLAKSRMTRGGVLQQWFPGGHESTTLWEKKVLASVARSLVESFPYVRVFHSYEGWGHHFLASNEPIEIPSTEIAVARLSDAAQRDLLEWLPGKNIPELITQIFSQETDINTILDPQEYPWQITDDKPVNEYFLMRRVWSHIRPSAPAE